MDAAMDTDKQVREESPTPKQMIAKNFAFFVMHTFWILAGALLASNFILCK